MSSLWGGGGQIKGIIASWWVSSLWGGQIKGIIVGGCPHLGGGGGGGAGQIKGIIASWLMSSLWEGGQIKGIIVG